MNKSTDEVDSSLANEYKVDNLRYMLKKEHETKNRPSTKYMSVQHHVTFDLRMKLFDWLMGVCEFYVLPQEVWFLALNYFDRFLSVVVVKESDVQLLGMTCLYIAWKVDCNSSVREIKEVAKLSYGAFSANEMLEMEEIVLNILNFDLSPPTASYFCHKFLEETHAEDSVCHLSMMLLELMAMNGEHSLNFLPSEIAGASIFVARLLLHKPPWDESLVDVSRYEWSSILRCAKEVHGIFYVQPIHSFEHIREKYTSKRFNRVALTKVLPLSSYEEARPFLNCKPRLLRGYKQAATAGSPEGNYRPQHRPVSSSRTYECI